MAKKGITEIHRKERLGERCANISGYISEIIEYNGADDIKVRFIDTGEEARCEYRQWKLGRVKSNYQPSVFGVGIVGKEYPFRDENGKVVRSYVTWKGMLERCYSEKRLEKYPTYRGCSVCEEWLYYPNFKKWYDEHYYEVEGERMHLDKDLKVVKNKIYSPDACVFLPNAINVFFSHGHNYRNRELPTGLSIHPTAGLACKTPYGNIYGISSIEEGMRIYKEAKEKKCKELAEEYKDLIPEEVYNIMINWEYIE